MSGYGRNFDLLLAMAGKAILFLFLMGTGVFVRLIDAVAAGALVLAMAAFLQSDAHASLLNVEQDNSAPRPLVILSDSKAPALTSVSRARTKSAGNPGGWLALDGYPNFAFPLGAKEASGFRLYFDEKKIEKSCHAVMTGMPAVVGLAARNYGLEDRRGVNCDITLFIDQLQTAEELQRAGVGGDRDHVIADCTLARHKGGAALLYNACATMRDERFVVAPVTEGAPSRRNGWVVDVIGYKTGP